MSQVYLCDACNVKITDPHKVKMKEFYVGCSYELFGTFPVDSTRKVKVHLCDDCYKGLRMIAKNRSQIFERN